MRMTVTEIAAHVGVHKSTVSRQARAHNLVGADGRIDLSAYQALRANGLDPVMQTSGPAVAASADAESGLAAERLRKMAAHKTVLIVTHRNSLLDLATRVIVVDDGKIVADGPRDQVIQALQSGRVGRAA